MPRSPFVPTLVPALAAALGSRCVQASSELGLLGGAPRDMLSKAARGAR
ncbi:MAG TPA: hypothetical protein VMT70_15760 [Vicinamibacteria bacterium]|nr:hypothetical protein [Vicinamibacteria bacterium]